MNRRTPPAATNGATELPLNGTEQVTLVSAGDGAAPATMEIPAQLGIQVRAIAGGGVELRQETLHGGFDDDETDQIDVKPRNAVALARKLLLAVGFKNITITESTGYDEEELRDGSTPGDFEYKPPAPPVVAKSPAEITAALEAIAAARKPPPEPDPPFDWNGTRILESQPMTAVYETVSGALGIRQEPFDIHDEDLVVIVTPPHLQAFVNRLNAVASAILKGAA
jgi:hypothetical protein